MKQLNISKANLKSELYELYINQHKSTIEIAKEFNTSPKTIHNWLKKYKINVRSVSESMLPKGIIKPTKKELEELYLTNFEKANKIGKRFGVSRTTILKWLKEYNIKVRNHAEAKLSQNFVIPSKEELMGLYINEHQSALSIAKRYKVSHHTVQRWLAQCGIKVRDTQESHLPKNYIKPTRHQLEKLYLNEFKSSKEIASIFKIDPSTVIRLLKEYGIPIRKPKNYVLPLVWENLCFEIANAIIRKPIKRHPTINNGTLLQPDFGYNRLKGNYWEFLFDAKWHCYQRSIENDIKNYSPHCDILEFWCLRGKGLKLTNNKVRIVTAKDIIKQLQRINTTRSKELINKIFLINKGINIYDKGQKKLIN